MRATRHRLNFEWLTRLRWMALAGGVVFAVLGDVLLGGALPLAWILGLLAAQAVGQGALVFRGVPRLAAWDDARWERYGERVLLLSLLADIVVLSAVLALSGGPANPFVVVFLAHVALAAVVLPGRPAALLAGAAFACYLGLFFWAIDVAGLTATVQADSAFVVPTLPDDVLRVHGPSWAAPGAPPEPTGPSRFSIHTWGALFAFGGSAALVVYFVSRVGASLRRREAELALERSRREAAERVRSLATLAAGAAHELASPLSTIAVVASELERAVDRDTLDRALLRDDVRLIQREVDLCREVLDDLAFDAGASRAHAPDAVLLAPLIAELEGGQDASGLRIDASIDASSPSVRVDARALVRSLRNLARNARAAQAGSLEIDAVVDPRDERFVRLSLRDDGHGMSASLVERAHEPFFTTSEPGRGLGLGLFLVRRFCEMSGGELRIVSRVGQGTTVTLVLPRGEPPPDDPAPPEPT